MGFAIVLAAIDSIAVPAKLSLDDIEIFFDAEKAIKGEQARSLPLPVPSN
jgi:hypothetical protein